jgi:hypothetical protein
MLWMEGAQILRGGRRKGVGHLSSTRCGEEEGRGRSHGHVVLHSRPCLCHRRALGRLHWAGSRRVGL